MLAGRGDGLAEVEEHGMVARLAESLVHAPEDALLRGAVLLLDVAVQHHQRDEARELLGVAAALVLAWHGGAGAAHDGAAVRKAGDEAVALQKLGRGADHPAVDLQLLADLALGGEPLAGPVLSRLDPLAQDAFNGARQGSSGGRLDVRCGHFSACCSVLSVPAGQERAATRLRPERSRCGQELPNYNFRA